MQDSIATFQLRFATSADLGAALGRSYYDYIQWHGQAVIIAGFAQDAHQAGIKEVVTSRYSSAFNYAVTEGIITSPGEMSEALSDRVYDRHIAVATQGVKIAAIVMLHNACERYLWRLVRFGMVYNRNKALKFIENQQLTYKKLQEAEPDVLMDNQLECMWKNLERDKLETKWDRVVSLLGMPTNMSCDPWHFDKDRLLEFDNIRHKAVHHDGKQLSDYCLIDFATQLSRMQLLWLVHVAKKLDIKIAAQTILMGS